jgi:hypothetical protein
MSWLADLERALGAAPVPVPVFFRDDDAGWADERLLALLDVFAGCGGSGRAGHPRRAVPLDLAVIPDALSPALARELLARPGVGLHQHGRSHANHEPEGRKHEFGPSRGAIAQRADVAEGRERLAWLLGDRVDPIFTPPWNRCTPDTGRCLVELGFAVLSREARAVPLGLPGLRELPVHVDFVRLAPEELGRRAAEAVRHGGPLGVMLHHEVMDDDAMARAGRLARLVAEHPHARPARMIALAGSAAGARAP